MIIMAISNLVPRLPDQVLWTNAKPATAALRSKSPEKVFDDDDDDDDDDNGDGDDDNQHYHHDA